MLPEPQVVVGLSIRRLLMLILALVMLMVLIVTFTLALVIFILAPVMHTQKLLEYRGVYFIWQLLKCQVRLLVILE